MEGQITGSGLERLAAGIVMKPDTKKEQGVSIEIALLSRLP